MTVFSAEHRRLSRATRLTSRPKTLIVVESCQRQCLLLAVYTFAIHLSAGYSEDSDYTSDLNYPVGGQGANSSASQFRTAANQLATPQRSLETSRENSYERDDHQVLIDRGIVKFALGTLGSNRCAIIEPGMTVSSVCRVVSISVTMQKPPTHGWL